MVPDTGPDAEIALHYQHAGLAEHASVASFSNAVLELMHLGAPASLVDRTLAAAREEVRHAQMSFAIAQAWSAEAFHVDGIDTPPEAHSSSTLAEFVRRTALEACAGETPAVLRAAMALDLAQDKQVREYLRAVVAEERRHAELAWATLAWALIAEARNPEASVSAKQAALDALNSAASDLAAEAQASTGRSTVPAMHRARYLLRVGILSQELKAEAARMGAALVERLRALLLDEQLLVTGLAAFESDVRHHFEQALAEARSSKVNRVDSHVV